MRTKEWLCRLSKEKENFNVGLGAYLPALVSFIMIFSVVFIILILFHEDNESQVNDSYDVLEMHRKKNGLIRPPNLESLLLKQISFSMIILLTQAVFCSHGKNNESSKAPQALFCSRDENTESSQLTASHNQHGPTSPRNQAIAATSRNQAAISHNQQTAPLQKRNTSTSSSRDEFVAPTSRNQHTTTSQSQVTSTTMALNQSMAATSSRSQLMTTSSRGRTFGASSRNPFVAATSHNQHTETSRSQVASTAVSHNRSAATTSSRSQPTPTSQARITASSHHPADALAADRATPHHVQLDHNDDTNANGDDANDNGNESDDETDDSEDPIPRAKRNSKKSHHDPYPHHLGYYTGTWRDVLVEAKTKYRLFIHTQNPFPERNKNGLRDAHDCLLETITKFKDDGTQIDEGKSNIYQHILLLLTNITDLYNSHRSSMTALVSSIILTLQ